MSSNMRLNWIIAFFLFFLKIKVNGMSCLKTSECTCEIGSHGGILVNCNGRYLTKIPKFELNDLSAQIYEISLQDNDIAEIPAFSFNGTILKKLDITNNPLKLISEQAFFGVEESLTELLIGSKVDYSLSIPSIPLRAMVSLERLTIMKFIDIDVMEETFANLIKLKELSLTDGFLENISPLAFKEQSNVLERLDLSRNNFRAMPVDSISKLTNLESLSLSSNKIKAFEGGSFDTFKNLKILNIDRLNRPAIEKNTFRGLSGSLEVLNMAASKFTDQVLDEIKQLTSLTHMYASYNEFTKLERFLDGSLGRLKLLDLQDNFVSKIDQLKSETLETLILENNQITEVTPDAFHGLPSLTSLNLNNAEGLKFNENTFKSQATNLKELRINKVNLSQPYWKALSILKSIEILGASKCDFSDIPDFMFYSMSQLKTLILDENSISSLSQRSLYGLGPSLQYMSLTGNKLSTLEECVFHNFKEIDVVKLKLDRNPLVCDCRMKWLYDRIKILRTRPDAGHLVLLLQWKCDNLDLKFNSLSDIHFTDCVSYEPPKCEELQEFSTTELPKITPSELFVTDIKSNSFIVHWNGTVDENTHYFLSYEKPEGPRQHVDVSSGIFECLVNDVDPSSTYMIFLTIVSSGSINRTIQASATTISWIEDHRQQVIVGTVVGVGLFLLALLLVFFFIFRLSSRKPNVPIVEITQNSKRYVKNTDYSKVNIRQSRNASSHPSAVRSEDIIKSTLDNMSEDEKYRLMNLLTNSRGSLDALNEDFLERKIQRNIYEEIPNDVYDEIEEDKTV